MCQISTCIQTLGGKFFTNNFAAYWFVLGMACHFPFVYPIALMQKLLLLPLIYIALVQYIADMDTWLLGSLQGNMRMSLKK